MIVRWQRRDGIRDDMSTLRVARKNQPLLGAIPNGLLHHLPCQLDAATYRGLVVAVDPRPSVNGVVRDSLRLNFEGAGGQMARQVVDGRSESKLACSRFTRPTSPKKTVARRGAGGG